MISLDRAKEILNDPKLSDTEVEQIRDECRILVEIIFERWEEERAKARKEKEAQRPEEDKNQITLNHHAKQNQ